MTEQIALTDILGERLYVAFQLSRQFGLRRRQRRQRAPVRLPRHGQDDHMGENKGRRCRNEDDQRDQKQARSTHTDYQLPYGSKRFSMVVSTDSTKCAGGSFRATGTLLDSS